MNVSTTSESFGSMVTANVDQRSAPAHPQNIPPGSSSALNGVSSRTSVRPQIHRCNTSPVRDPELGSFFPWNASISGNSSAGSSHVSTAPMSFSSSAMSPYLPESFAKLSSMTPMMRSISEHHSALDQSAEKLQSQRAQTQAPTQARARHSFDDDMAAHIPTLTTRPSLQSPSNHDLSQAMPAQTSDDIHAFAFPTRGQSSPAWHSAAPTPSVPGISPAATTPFERRQSIMAASGASSPGAAHSTRIHMHTRKDSFGKALMQRLVNSKSVKRIRTVSTSSRSNSIWGDHAPQQQQQPLASVVFARTNNHAQLIPANRDEGEEDIGGNAHGFQAPGRGDRMAPPAHHRVRSDSAPEIWSSRQVAGRPSRPQTSGSPSAFGGLSGAAYIEHEQHQSSLPTSRISSVINLTFSRRGKRKAVTGSGEGDGTRSPSTSSLLSASRPRASRLSSFVAPSSFSANAASTPISAAHTPAVEGLSASELTQADSTGAGGMNQDSSAGNRVAGMASALHVRRPVLLQQQPHVSPLAASTSATQASGSILEPGHSSSRSQSPAPLQRNYFDRLLNRELKLYIFQKLAAFIAHDAAERSQGVRGEAHHVALRQMVKLACVSRGWASLVLDGQLWRNLDLTAFEGMQFVDMMRLASSFGSFVQHVDLAGMSNLPSQVILAIVKASVGAELFTASSSPGGMIAGSSLRSIDISRCQDLSEDALIRAVLCCPSLRSFAARNVPSMTDGIVRALSHVAARLESVDLSGKSGISSAAVATLLGSAPSLRILKLAALRGVNKDLMATLKVSTPYLEVLDLSYCKDLDDDAFMAFLTSSTPPNEPEVPPAIFTLVPSQRTLQDPFKQLEGYRRITSLRALSISGCRRITDRTCALLAGAVPRLETFQAAGLGPTLKNPGLIALLGSTPYLTRLDLEGATELSDGVLDALLSATPQGESNLTHLIISHAINITADALYEFIQKAPSLVHLQADDTRADDDVARVFTQRVRARQACNAYLSLIDCRSFAKATAIELASSNTVRPRAGKVGFAYRHFAYDDGAHMRPHSGPQILHEHDSSRVTLKSFWGWQAVDARAQAIRKGKARRGIRARAAVGDNGINMDDEDSSTSRLGRFAAVLLAAGEEADNAPGCSIM
ncbi:hypothetical protein K437DRAFT_246858 [Tilletiaria anomala UBC 951]|uniref:RNI-like protein n=1 Tax=Tilletiaria anomala (strain ATCC 24038 / CBS 436.72 / UBC 951) TaxID=1037660 RepID=A0A066W4A3_TILAU|nr:uncharacterized protein K437DRAFT_246858 [Tilletiaria anomala UBC 951]KDN45884.1 hypothetical protein K437DRAFT_246858 [Tilletiaria anomala UBC 951]